ncbi:formylglycine-generating enzyme family protein [Polyangium jinanense]|uniref:SUMF1/EgtB/PvdO family nonheme iron enzyme n=1 Tax=Polyangium jinanense TaxID=2829994 RepID=A0A9X3WWC7_9BACT|nr:SUMF1/EgtB/PvdO family nonheme iron enzyme [Polyangium jinanense]MDC3953386.1 SUMF1/EgtB/PvdO family nonheme iron enzyme [Polyangium jinanense]MDC3979494.1 SUMF1/EgtB/PvdO family nonheme iron enzyme [Polyangium jinanense]
MDRLRASWLWVGLGFAGLFGCGTPGVRPADPVVAEPTLPARTTKTTEPVQPASDDGGCPDGMVEVPGGKLRLRASRDEVTLARFCMDRTEVTMGRYAACVKAGKCSDQHLDEFSAEGTFYSLDDACNYGEPGKEDHPMNCVDWNQAATFCKTYGHRLPSEEEWVWAARGGPRGTTYSWGEAEPSTQLCWSGISKRDGTCPVGSFPADDSPEGIHDLAGNVCEWTASVFEYEPKERMLCGGAWSDNHWLGVRSASHEGEPPASRGSSRGFRCVHDLP